MLTIAQLHVTRRHVRDKYKCKLYTLHCKENSDNLVFRLTEILGSPVGVVTLQ